MYCTEGDTKVECDVRDESPQTTRAKWNIKKERDLTGNNWEKRGRSGRPVKKEFERFEGLRDTLDP